VATRTDLPPEFTQAQTVVEADADTTAGPHDVTMDAIVELCKRRGIIFQSSEIYGGLRGAWDFGPLGAALKDNVKAAWKRSMLQLRDDVVQLDASILMHPRVWEASGHVEGFTDPLVECTNCNQRWKPGTHVARAPHMRHSRNIKTDIPIYDDDNA
jgi:glycyl-tRNA synthetase (class II)